MKNLSDGVLLPGPVGRISSRVGLGMATVMRAPDKVARRRILDKAHAAGIVHFDVAPLYGTGVAEVELGEFVRCHPESTVCTKVGLLPNRLMLLARGVQQPMRRALDRHSSLKSRIKSSSLMKGAAPLLTPAFVEASVDSSLRRMNLDHIDVLLLHDVTVNASNHDIVAALEREKDRGRVGAFGISGGREVINGWLAAEADVDVIQTSVAGWSTFKPVTVDRSSFLIRYGLLSGLLSSVLDEVSKRPSLLDELRIRIEGGDDANDAELVAASMTAVYASRSDFQILLVGSSSEKHVDTISNSLGAADRIGEVAEFVDICRDSYLSA